MEVTFLTTAINYFGEYILVPIATGSVLFLMGLVLSFIVLTLLLRGTVKEGTDLRQSSMGRVVAVFYTGGASLAAAFALLFLNILEKGVLLGLFTIGLCGLLFLFKSLSWLSSETA